MKCQSGKHNWIEPISAERCCNAEWHRALRPWGSAQDLDEKGRAYDGTGFVHGWVKKEKALLVRNGENYDETNNRGTGKF